MWPFRKKIKFNCPNCGQAIKVLWGEVCHEQTKIGINIVPPSDIQCKNCRNEVILPTIRIDNNGSINFKR